MSATIWISVSEAATRLGVTRQTVYNLLTSKMLKGTKLGGFQLVDAASVKMVGQARRDIAKMKPSRPRGFKS